MAGCGTFSVSCVPTSYNQMRDTVPPRYCFHWVKRGPIGLYAIRRPSGEYVPLAAFGMSNRSGMPPSRETVNSCWWFVVNTARADVNSTLLPSGVKPWTVSAPGCQVKRFGTPPSDATT